MSPPMTRLLPMAAVFLLLPAAPRGGCPLPQHLAPCGCGDTSPFGPEVSCVDLDGGQLREVLDVLQLSRRRLWFLRIGGTDLFSASKAIESLLASLDLVNLVLVRANLTSIDLSDTVVSGGSSSTMESLDLSCNRLSRVPSRLPRSLSALRLDHNAIESLEAHSFSGLPSLLVLSLRGNRIRLVDSRAFLGTEDSLTRLDMGGNRLGQVPRYALQRLHCLQGLRLHDNNISEVLVENLPTSLCDLDLSGNDLARLGADAFAPLARLSALDLEDNALDALHEHALRGTHDTLEWLKLGGNRLRRVPSSALRNLTRLRQLDLRRNRIARLEVGDFDGYGGTLRFVFLQKNSIQTIAEGALAPLVSAQWLYLHSNSMRELRQTTLAPILDNLHVLDLHDNPYRCDCHILWFRDWLLAKGRDVVNLPRETRCNATREPLANLANDSRACAGRASSKNLPSEVERMAYLILALMLVAASS